jgi:glycolate oxidase FAD binding subunit
MADTIGPKSESELADAVRGAAAHSRTLEIVSGGTKRNLGRATKSDALLDMRAFSGVLKYEPHELVFSARAATPLVEIAAMLAEKKQMLAFEPADWGPLLSARASAATLAGIAAANVCGPRRVKAGAVRDHLIGCRFVNGKGEPIKAGGAVVKNVTGFDITKLMCGAFGTLGALSELTFRVVPKPERSAVLSLRGANAAQGLRALREAARLPLEATGLAYLPRAALPVAFGQLAGETGVALIRVEGAREPVDEKLQRLQTAFAALDAVALEDELGAALFRGIGEGMFLALTASDLWRVHLPSSEAEGFLEDIAPPLWQADCAGSVLWLALAADAATQARLQARAARSEAHVSLLRASAAARATLSVFPPLEPAQTGLTRSVKAAFDPAGIFNPGRMYEGI